MDADWEKNANEIKAQLKESGLWDDEQIDKLHINRMSSSSTGTPMRGLSTYNAGELLGTSYKNIQAYCKSGKMASDRDILSSRVIPVEEVIKWKRNHQ